MGLKLNREAYQAYLKSPYWGRVKKKVWNEHGGYCNRCGKFGRDVHHLNYDYIGHEFEHTDTLVLLCRHCHRYVHDALWWQKLLKFLGIWYG